VVDGNNVMGAGGDGWWNDRAAAAIRTTEAVASWCRTHDDQVQLVFDEPEAPSLGILAGGNLSILHATRRGRDAADDRIVGLVQAVSAADGAVPTGVTVVTSDRGLRARLAPGLEVEGAGAFRRRVGLPMR
jgi:predicted RNA-binding protein with PIN domain